MFSNLVIGVNGRPGDRDAAALASVLAEPGAHLTFVRVRFDDLLPDWRFDGVMAPESLPGGAIPAGSDVQIVVAGSVGEGLKRAAQELGAGLIVVGACARGPVGRVVVGDDAASVLHQTRCHVAIAPRGYAATRHRIRTIGVAFDGSIESQAALGLGESLAERLAARLVARCVVSPHVMATGIASYMEDPADLLARTRASLGERASSTEIIIGPSEKELAAFSREVDVMVCGTRHNGVLRRLASGTISGYLAHHSRSPLLVAACPDTLETDAPDLPSASATSTSG